MFVGALRKVTVVPGELAPNTDPVSAARLARLYELCRRKDVVHERGPHGAIDAAIIAM